MTCIHLRREETLGGGKEIPDFLGRRKSKWANVEIRAAFGIVKDTLCFS